MSKSITSFFKRKAEDPAEGDSKSCREDDRLESTQEGSALTEAQQQLIDANREAVRPH